MKQTFITKACAVLLALGSAGAGLTGCASSPAVANNGGTTTNHPAAATPGSGKGHWVVEPTPQTGTLMPRRVWVPDDGSAPVAAAGTGATTYGGNSAGPGSVGYGGGASGGGLGGGGR